MKRISIFIMALVLLLLQFNNYSVHAASLIMENEYDTSIIPDKYNTGCSGELRTISFWEEADGVLFISGSNDTRYVLDFYYRNKEISGTVSINNYDFSSYPVVSYHEDMVDRTVKVIFNNCRFSSISVGRLVGNISYEFNNCSMNSFYGSNSKLNRCQFGENFSDGIVPFCNIEVNDCFFKDMGGVVTDKAAHTDGTQIYGDANSGVNNVIYSNCRFEIPPVRKEESSAYINACIMLQLEFSSAENLKFKNCIVNGGGYSIYARSIKEEHTLTNVAFDGIKFGGAYKYGIFYTDVTPTIDIKNVSQIDSLYVGSVWKENGNTHFSVTNDTNIERKLLIYTNKSNYEFTIPACFTSSQITGDTVYSDYPFDIDIKIEEDLEYAVCYDVTVSGIGKQIRYNNWRLDKVYLSDDLNDYLYSNSDEVLVSGQCGKDITFTLTKSGTLLLKGTGDTYNYHSQKFPEWHEYKDFIKRVYVGEGITGLGNQIFRHAKSIEEISLPSTLTSIGGYALGGCVSIEKITLPENISSLGNSVLSGTVLSEIIYLGDDWSSVSLGTGNDNILEKLVLQDEEVPGQIIEEESDDNSITEENENVDKKSNNVVIFIVLGSVTLLLCVICVIIYLIIKRR